MAARLRGLKVFRAFVAGFVIGGAAGKILIAISEKVMRDPARVFFKKLGFRGIFCVRVWHARFAILLGGSSVAQGSSRKNCVRDLL